MSLIRIGDGPVACGAKINAPAEGLLRFWYTKDPASFGHLSFYQVFEGCPRMDRPLHVLYDNGLRRLIDLQGMSLAGAFARSELSFCERRDALDSLLDNLPLILDARAA